MSASSLYRLSGLALVLGSLLFAVGNLMHPLEHSVSAQAKPTWEAAHITFMIGGIIMVLGLPGAYLRQSLRAGRLGLIGFVVLVIGLIGIAPSAWYEAFVVNPIGPDLADKIEGGAGGTFNAIAGLFLVFGPFLFGIATWRAKVFARYAALASVLSTPILLVLGGLPGKTGGAAIIFGTVVFSVAYAWIGYELVTGGPAAAEVPSGGAEATPGIDAAVNQATPQLSRVA